MTDPFVDGALYRIRSSEHPECHTPRMALTFVANSIVRLRYHSYDANARSQGIGFVELVFGAPTGLSMPSIKHYMVHLDELESITTNCDTVTNHQRTQE